MRLTSFRHYRKRDSKALIGFVGLLLYVGSYTYQRVPHNTFLSVLDTLHTILCVYMMYW